MSQELSRQELFDLVWAEPMVALAKKFEISDVGLRKICERFNIPLPKSGHWQRVRAGKEVTRPVLHNKESNEKISLIKMERPDGKKVYPWTQRQLEIEKDPKLNLVVPERLRNADSLVVSAQKALSNGENKSWKFSGMRDAGRGMLNIVVQPKLIARALAFMDTLIKLLRARGHEIEIQADATYVIIKDYRAKIQLKERSKIVVEQSGSWPTRRFLPTGILAFKSDAYHQLEWADGSKKLEEQLSNIVARMETNIEELHEIWRQNRISEENEKERIRLIEESHKRKEDELKNFKDLMDQAPRWKKVQVLREFLSNAKSLATKENRLSEDFLKWYDWAVKKVDWYDPYVEAPDEVLADVNRNDLTFKKVKVSKDTFGWR